MYRGTLEPVSNSETWWGHLEFFDDETGEVLFEEDDAETHPDAITLKVRDKRTETEVLSGSLGSELTITDDGVVEFEFSATLMSALEPKTYEVGVLYTQEDRTTQVILGEISVLKGL